jgi:hypothetical protein
MSVKPSAAWSTAILLKEAEPKLLTSDLNAIMWLNLALLLTGVPSKKEEKSSSSTTTTTTTTTTRTTATTTTTATTKNRTSLSQLCGLFDHRDIDVFESENLVRRNQIHNDGAGHM